MTDETTEPAPTPAPTHAPTTTPTASTAASSTDPLSWGTSFDPDRLALLELRIWKAYYRREALKLFGLVVMGLREQAQVSWPRALLAGKLVAHPLSQQHVGGALGQERAAARRPDPAPERLQAPGDRLR